MRVLFDGKTQNLSMCVTSLGRPYNKIRKRRCQCSRQFKHKRESNLDCGHFDPMVPEQG
jgi:hypothetical protein